jgi:V8-like Glu-specific endopeptidase
MRWLAVLTAGALVAAASANATDVSGGSAGVAVVPRSAETRDPALKFPKQSAPAVPPSTERAVEAKPVNPSMYAAIGRASDGRALMIPPSELLSKLVGEEGGRPASPTLGGKNAARTVWPPDDRIQVQDTTAFPYRTIGYVEGATESGAYTSCTGVLVGPRLVLVAAHCLYDHDQGGWLKDFVFVPGLADAEKVPFGVAAYEEAYILQGYVENYLGYYGSVMAWDLGLLVIDQPHGESLGWMAFGGDGLPPGGTVTLAGYFGDKPAGTMWTVKCPIEIDPSLAELFQYQCAQPGIGGGPLFVHDDTGYRIYGIHLAQSPDSLIGLRLTPTFVAWINDIAR